MRKLMAGFQRPIGIQRREHIMQFVIEREAQGLPAPTLREICAAIGIKSTSNANYHVQKLVKEGKLARLDSGRIYRPRQLVADGTLMTIAQAGDTATLTVMGFDKGIIEKGRHYRVEIYREG